MDAGLGLTEGKKGANRTEQVKGDSQGTPLIPASLLPFPIHAIYIVCKICSTGRSRQVDQPWRTGSLQKQALPESHWIMLLGLDQYPSKVKLQHNECLSTLQTTYSALYVELPSNNLLYPSHMCIRITYLGQNKQPWNAPQ
eukprot:1159860-Pelagomonas_calceolata.AAC.2